MKRSTPHRGSLGFTLIEILMVVIIMGIASAIIVPQLATRDDLKVASAARLVMADLMYAQNQAIVTQTKQYVKFDVPGKQYKLCTSVSPEVIMTNPLTQTSFIETFGSATTPQLQQMTLTSASFDAKAILGFDQLGTPLSVAADGTTTAMTSGSVVVTVGGFPLTITVQPYTGELSVQ